MKNNSSSSAAIQELFDHIHAGWTKQKTPTWIDLAKELEMLRLILSTSSHRALLILSRHRSLLIARYLLSDKGELLQEKVDEVLQDLLSSFFTFSPFPAEESSLTGHLVSCLQELKKNKNLTLLLKRIGLVFGEPLLERIVLLTCTKGEKITPYESRLAILSAYLCPLRQTVGSCFATAPAILIQDQQAETFLSDLVELLQKGELRRVIEGKQIAIPISRKFDFIEFTQKIAVEELSYEPLLQLYEPFLYAFSSSQEVILPIQKSDLLATLAREQKQKVMSLKELFSTTYENLYHIPPPEEAEQIFKLELLSKQVSPLLKAWEYTISSFTQGGRSFSDWNLYISLGLSPKEPHGLGNAISQEIDLEREQLLKKVERMNGEIVSSAEQLKMLESLLKQASSEREIARLKAQFQAMLHHHYSCKELARDSIEEGNHLFELFNSFLEWLHGNFEEFFQELFDPELFFAKEELTFDSPAGFRLFAKGGREGTFAWSALENIEQFQQALIEFFQQIEPRVLERFPKRPDQKILLQWLKIIHTQLRSPLFLESAMERARRAHLSIIDKTGNTALQSMQATPWCYLSGGSMKELVQYYFGLSHPPTIEMSIPQDTKSLIAYLEKTIIHSGLSPKTDQRLLAQSPNHGFTVFTKELFSLSAATENHKKGQQLLYDRHIAPEHAQQLIHDFLAGWPEGVKESFLRQIEIKEIRRQGDWLKSTLQLMESLLPGPLFRNASSLIYSYFRKKVLHVSAGELRDILKLNLENHVTLSCEEIFRKACMLSSHSAFDVEMTKQLIYQFQNKGLLPSSILFGDTNWSGYSMGACFDPIKSTYSLWRVDPWGVFGYPLFEWDTDCFPGNWGIYTKPVEYTLLSKQFYLKV